MLTETQIDKIKGTIYGQAIGDALGLGTEFLSKNEVQEYYPNGLKNYSEIIQDKHRSRWPIGAWTDDTDQALCIIDSILDVKRVSEHAFANELVKWFNGNPMGIGNTVLRVLTIPQFKEYPHKASQLAWKLSGRKGAANGAIMRTSILGLWEFWNQENVIFNSESICKVTHFDSRCIGSCVIASSIISNLISLNKELSTSEIIEIGNNYDPRISEFIYLASDTNIETLNLEEKVTMGYTLKTLSAALWSYFHCNSFEEGLLKVVNEGGDADTNAAIACSILGAKFGFKSIPQKYITEMHNNKQLLEKTEKFIQLLKSEYSSNFSKK